MSGLIQKDICLLMQRKSALGMIFGLGIMMAFVTDGSFVVGYITMLSAIITTSTIAYDEFDNGYPFLMTLPITRSMYVQSKYLFSVVTGLIGWAFAMVVYVISQLVKGIGLTGADFVSPIILIPVFLIILAVMIPIQLKYGSEAMRFVIAVIAGGVVVIAFIGSKILPEGMQMPAWMLNMGEGAIVVCALAAGVIAMVISYPITVRIMNNKEF